MLKLMKYEFRKTTFSKIIILIVTAVAELVFLYGVFSKSEDGLAWGIIGLALCAVVGISYIGIESLLVFHKDLNTKQSYMLFLTPRNSYQILGAKVLENGISIFLSGVFFAALAAIDATVAIVYIGGLKELLDFLKEISMQISINIDITPQAAFLGFMMVLASWLLMIVIGYLAIVLAATVLAGKKISGFVSFVIYMLISVVSGKILDFLPVLKNDYAEFGMVIGVTFVLIIIMYTVSGWIMERKLSV